MPAHFRTTVCTIFARSKSSLTAGLDCNKTNSTGRLSQPQGPENPPINHYFFIRWGQTQSFTETIIKMTLSWFSTAEFRFDPPLFYLIRFPKENRRSLSESNVQIFNMKSSYPISLKPLVVVSILVWSVFLFPKGWNGMRKRLLPVWKFMRRPEDIFPLELALESIHILFYYWLTHTAPSSNAPGLTFDLREGCNKCIDAVR